MSNDVDVDVDIDVVVLVLMIEYIKEINTVRLTIEERIAGSVTAVVSKRQKRNALIIGECVQNRVSKGD
jgi:hypothetical protein